MINARHFAFLLPALLLSINVFAVPVGEIANALFHVMSKSAGKTTGTLTHDMGGFISRHPGFMSAAKHIGKNLSDDDRVRVSKILEQVLREEYSKLKIPMHVALTCGACIPKTFADDLNGRAISIIRKHDDLMLKIAAQPEQILRVLDSDGKPIVRSAVNVP